MNLIKNSMLALALAGSLSLTGCGYNNVVRVDVETDQGTASYSFQ